MNGTRVFESLNAEWALVCAESEPGETVLGWLQEGGVLLGEYAAGGLGDVLAELERRDRAQGRAHSDRWLRVLLERAAGEGAGALLAARVVVQAMVPGAVRLTQRLRASRDFDEVGQVVAACLYQVVRRYPLRRKGGVAANLLLETLHLASRELKAEAAELNAVPWQPAPDSAVVAGHLVAADDPAAAAWQAVLGQQAVAAGLVKDDEAADDALVELLVWAVAVGRLDAERARAIVKESRAGAQASAERDGVSAVAWRQRRSRTVRQLRAVADEWVQAA
ncbi:hypothetical protein [Streptomyces sp. ITFR-6]|uniref:hypothetical protein n=1 Tax=Streptomyces sp. ITFR-6 TaxID=3075197 RepID=UPI00288BF4E8|nr:hypothetical protein [Streptomyces sp. ITFR-6]WNI34470.1 hypothetical protein RLT59_38295 [Streptomyces sp. ITFR-6]